MNRMNGKNQYRCHFCEKICERPLVSKCPEFGKYARWHGCWKCNVMYAVGPKCTIRGVQFWTADPKSSEGSSYQMLIDFKNKKTKIDHYEARETEYTFTGGSLYLSPGDKIIIGSDPTNEHIVTSVSNGSYKAKRKEYLFTNVLKLDKALNGITPKNVYEKIKMYILFS
jgi:hypothetical protein